MVEVKSEVEIDDTRQSEVKHQQEPEQKSSSGRSSASVSLQKATEDLVKKIMSDSSEITISAVSIQSPLIDDPQPIRITPPLYTYSNPVVMQRDETPSPASQNAESESQEVENVKRRRRRKQELEGRQDIICIDDTEEHFVQRPTKSLLEQLLIEIPSDNGDKRYFFLFFFDSNFCN